MSSSNSSKEAERVLADVRKRWATDEWLSETFRLKALSLDRFRVKDNFWGKRFSYDDMDWDRLRDWEPVTVTAKDNAISLLEKMTVAVLELARRFEERFKDVPSGVTFMTLGQVPQVLDIDEGLRAAGQDAFEFRIGWFGNAIHESTAVQSASEEGN